MLRLFLIQRFLFISFVFSAGIVFADLSDIEEETASFTKEGRTYYKFYTKTGYFRGTGATVNKQQQKDEHLINEQTLINSILLEQENGKPKGIVIKDGSPVRWDNRRQAFKILPVNPDIIPLAKKRLKLENTVPFSEKSLTIILQLDLLAA